MAQTSPKKKRLRRLKRQVSLGQRLVQAIGQVEYYQQQIRTLSAAGHASKVILLGILGQHGGELEVTKGTLQQLLESKTPMDWTTEDKPGDPLTLIVRLVAGQESVAAQEATGVAVQPQPVEPVADAPTADADATV